MAELTGDKAEIWALLERIRAAAAARDFDTYADCFVHAPYMTRWNASPVTGNFIRSGWDDIAARLRPSMAAGEGPSPRYEGAVDNLNIRVSGDMAWATFSRRYAERPPHRAGPYPAHHVRIFERHDGRWKVAFFGFLDPGVGRPDDAKIGLDGDGKVLWMSPSASAAMATDDDLVVRNGRLHIRNSRADQKLQAAIRWAAALEERFLPGRGAVPVLLEAGEGIPARIWWVLGDGGTILFSLGEPGQAAARLNAAAAVFGLSPAPTQVAGYILDGLALADIAAAMQIKPSSARTHLDRIFTKTGVRTQSALVRVLLSTAAPA